jgi:hypothetical protein
MRRDGNRIHYEKEPNYQFHWLPPAFEIVPFVADFPQVILMGEHSIGIAKLHQELGNPKKTAPKMVTLDELFVGQQAGTTAKELINGCSAKKIQESCTDWVD